MSDSEVTIERKKPGPKCQFTSEEQRVKKNKYLTRWQKQKYEKSETYREQKSQWNKNYQERKKNKFLEMQQELEKLKLQLEVKEE